MKFFMLLCTIVTISSCKKESSEPNSQWSPIEKDAAAVVVKKYDDICRSSQGSPVVLEVFNLGYPDGANITAVNLPDSFKVKGRYLKFDMFPVREEDEYYKITCFEDMELPKVVYVYNVRWLQ